MERLTFEGNFCDIARKDRIFEPLRSREGFAGNGGQEGWMNTGSIVRSWLLGVIRMSVSVSEKIALGGYPMQTTVRCLLLRGFWLTAQFARMYLKRRVMRMAKFISKSQMGEADIYGLLEMAGVEVRHGG